MVFVYVLTLIVFLLMCVLTCLVVLMQESKTTGLGASFGGDTQDSVFGTSTADVLKKFTAWLGVIFLVSCLFLSFWTQALNRPKTTVTPYPIEEVQK